MQKSTDVVVLGAGVAGCATAYYLARGGAKVTVVERDAIGSCASGYALGLLNPLTGAGIPGPNEALVNAGFEMHRALWPALQEEAEVDVQVRMMPHLELFLGQDEADDTREEMSRWSRAEGFSTQWLTRDEVLRLESRVVPEVEGGFLLESVAVLDSYRYTLALAQAAERHGATVVHGRAAGIETAGGRVTGVDLGTSRLACDSVVVALGPWSAEASSWLGVDVPVTPLKGEILYLEGLAPPLEYHMHGLCNVVQKADGMVWVGATEEDTGFDDSTTPRVRDLLMEQAIGTVPCLGGQSLVRQTACLRPITPDRQPIVGGVPGLEGAYLATGAEKKGILISPVLGRAVADLILNGTTDLPVGPFGLDRFAQEGGTA